MIPRRWSAELTKRWRLRLSVGLLAAASLVAADEALKEGYVFVLSDFINPAITHEKILAALLVAGLLAGMRR